MKTSVIEVGGMLSALSARGVEKQLAKLPGVHKAEVNYVAGSATVVYDETVTDLKTAATTAPARCCRSMCVCPRTRRTTDEESHDRAEER